QAWTDRLGRAAGGPAPEYGPPVRGGGPAAFGAQAASEVADAGRPVCRGLGGDRAAAHGSAGGGGADSVRGAGATSSRALPGGSVADVPAAGQAVARRARAGARDLLCPRASSG